MERTRAGQRGGDREQREELERLQAELAQVRRATAAAKETRERTLATLRSAVAVAQVERDSTEAKIGALEQELRAQERHVEHLRERLVAKQKEDEVLARGAALRDVVFVPTGDDRRQPYYRAEYLDENGRTISTEPELPPSQPSSMGAWRLLLLVAAPLLVLLYEVLSRAR